MNQYIPSYLSARYLTFSKRFINTVPSLRSTASSLFSIGENKSISSFYSDIGESKICLNCKRECCRSCKVEIYKMEGGFEEHLITEVGTFAICTPCRHDVCTESSFVLVCRCGKCGHDLCKHCRKSEYGIQCCQIPNHLEALDVSVNTKD